MALKEILLYVTLSFLAIGFTLKYIVGNIKANRKAKNLQFWQVQFKTYVSIKKLTFTTTEDEDKDIKGYATAEIYCAALEFEQFQIIQISAISKAWYSKIRKELYLKLGYHAY